MRYYDESESSFDTQQREPHKRRSVISEEEKLFTSRYRYKRRHCWKIYRKPSLRRNAEYFIFSGGEGYDPVKKQLPEQNNHRRQQVRNRTVLLSILRVTIERLLKYMTVRQENKLPRATHKGSTRVIIRIKIPISLPQNESEVQPSSCQGQVPALAAAVGNRLVTSREQATSDLRLNRRDMEATSREGEELSSIQDTRGARTLNATSLRATTHSDAVQRMPSESPTRTEHEEVLYSYTQPWMVGQAQNELSSKKTLDRTSNRKQTKGTTATGTQSNNHQRDSSQLPATPLQYFRKFRSKGVKIEKQKMSERTKQERLCSVITTHAHTSKTGTEFKRKNTKNGDKKLESTSLIPSELCKGKDAGEFRSLIRTTLTRVLMMVIFMPWSGAVSKSLTPQQPTIPRSKAYPQLTLQPPLQSHQSSDSTLHQSQATHFTVTPTSKSDAFSTRSVGSTRDGIGRSLGDERSHFLVNDINVEHDDSATSANEVHVGATGEERQENELQQRLRKEREKAAHKWAPVVWLHPKEIFFPGNVLDFLDNVNISSSDGLDIEEYGRDEGLPQGPITEEMHLLAPLDTECCNCPVPPFLHGQRPIRGEGPPVYAHIHTCYSAMPRPRTPRTPATPTMNLLLRTPPDGEPLKARSLRAQIRSLQHPLPRYRRRRLRPRGRGRRDTAHSPNPEDGESNENFNATFTRQERKLVLSEDQAREQNLKFHKEGKEEAEGSVTEGTSVLTSTVRTELVLNSTTNQPSTDPIHAASQRTTANLTSSKVSNTSDALLEVNTRPQKDGQYSSDSPHTDVDIALTTELPQAVTQDLPNFVQSPASTKISPTSQPIIIIGNYSRMRHVYATAIPAVVTAPRQKNSTDAATTSSPSPVEDTQPSRPNRRHALSTTGTPGHHFTITYWFFYPYNHGKEVCTTSMIFIGRVAKPLYKGECLGETVVMGNHVGDWEHLSIYFEDGEPRYLYLSAHHFGAFYTYQPDWHRFKYASQDVREGVHMSPQYPQYLELQQGRLVVYSARGSHGTWPSPGRHLYNNVMVKLEDETAQGHLWDTRHKVHIIDALEEKRRGATDTHRKWLDFRGKWGNPSSHCHPGMLGFCEIRDGPLGITMNRLNFPCHIPRHYTFPKP